MSQMDERLRRAVQIVHNEPNLYGGPALDDVLPSLCRDCNLPEHLGESSSQIFLPCEVIHCNECKICEVQAGYRWSRAWAQSMSIYFPIALLARIQRPSASIIWRAAKSSARSSFFFPHLSRLYGMGCAY